MLELRWVLLGLGLLVVVGVYLWGRGMLRTPQPPAFERRARPAPRIDADDPGDAEDEIPEDPEDTPRRGSQTKIVTRAPSVRAPDKVVTLRMVPRETEDGPGTMESAVLALRKHGLEHGEFGIFHRYTNDGGTRAALFSVANLTEPGTFDLTTLSEEAFAGLSLFIALPGECDPVDAFDSMLETARALAREVDAELFDDKGSSWSIQRERYIREEMIQYRHHLAHG